METDLKSANGLRVCFACRPRFLPAALTTAAVDSAGQIGYNAVKCQRLYETGLYYLKSRYYIPRYCRFTICDIGLAPEHGRFGNNMFTYCTNSPVMTYDDAGTEYDIVGWGLQIEGAAGLAFFTYGGGIEFILFFDTPEAREHGPFVAAYVYSEKNFNLGDFTGQMDALDEIATLLLNSADDLALDGANAMTAIATAGLPCSFGSLSGTVFAVTASDEFYGQHNYLGDFESMSINAWMLKGSTAWTEICQTYNVGVSTPSWGVSYTNSYYHLLKTWGGDMCEKCKEGILHDEYK